MEDFKLEKQLVQTGNFIVRRNLLNDPDYRPYCGNPKGKCSMPRTNWNGEQFVCPECKHTSEFPKEFIDYYKLKWNK